MASGVPPLAGCRLFDGVPPLAGFSVFAMFFKFACDRIRGVRSMKNRRPMVAPTRGGLVGRAMVAVYF